MSKNKDRVEGSTTVTAAVAKERRSSYGRRSGDLTQDDFEMIKKLEKVIQECTIELERAYKRMERNQEEFDRLKSKSSVMLSDTQQIIATFQTG